MRHSRLPSAAFALGVFLAAQPALADLVLLVPPRAQAESQSMAASLDKETRWVIAEVGHQLVSVDDTTAALKLVVDGTPDNANELSAMAAATHAQWVVVPVIHTQAASYQLELAAYQVSSGRTESAARDIDPSRMHEQVSEMAKVLLRPEGVGTGALPWESAAPPPPMPPPTVSAGSTTTAESKPPADQATASGSTTDIRFLLGAGLGLSSALSRPDGATGKTTTIHGALRAGLQLANPLELGIDLRSNLADPKATVLDLSARYWIDAAKGLRLAPEVAPGLFVMHGGAEDKSFLLRFSAIASFEVAPPVSLEAHVGDLSWIPASSGTLFLGGATLTGVARF